MIEFVEAVAIRWEAIAIRCAFHVWSTFANSQGAPLGGRSLGRLAASPLVQVQVCVLRPGNEGFTETIPDI